MFHKAIIYPIMKSSIFICAIYYNYRYEVMQSAKNGAFCTVWQIHGMASVLGVKISCVYPKFGNNTLTPLLNRVLYPHNQTTGKPKARRSG